MVKIAGDAGHGGSDPGACASGIKEKDVNLIILSRVLDTLQKNYLDVQVLKIRDGDKTMSLKQRTDKANAWGADFYISVHNNAGGGTGFESYRLPNAYTSTMKKQSIIHSEVMAYLKNFGVKDRGMKTANFHVLRETKMSAVLIECLFVDHPKDAALLKQTAVLHGIGDAIARGIAKAHGLKEKPKPTPKPSAPLPKVAREIAVRVDGKPVSAKGYLINGTTYLQGLFVAGLFGGSVSGHGDYINIKTKK